MSETRNFRDDVVKRVLLGAALLAPAACSGLADDVDGFSSEDWKRVQQMEPLGTPMPRNPFNLKDQDMAVGKLGQMLFFSMDLTDALVVDSPHGKKGEVGKIGCVSCHDPKRYFIDTHPGPVSWSRTGTLRRNTPTMVNLGWYEWIGWAGRFDSMVMHGSGALGLSTSLLSWVHYIHRKYRDEYNAAFPDTQLDPALDPMHPEAARFPLTGAPKANAAAPDGPWEAMKPEDQRIILQIQYNIGRAFDTYPRMLVTRSSPFERYVKGEHSALTPGARRGLELFIGKAACNDCHNGPLLSDNKFHNIGIADPPTATAPEMGRFNDMSPMLTNAFSGAGEFSDNREMGRQKHMAMDLKDERMKGALRTPMLLNVAETGPYFHTGLVNTLEDVVRHYNKGGDPTGFQGTKDPRLLPLGLTEPEIADIVEFLKSLTGAPAAEEWSQNIAKP